MQLPSFANLPPGLLNKKNLLIGAGVLVFVIVIIIAIALGGKKTNPQTGDGGACVENDTREECQNIGPDGKTELTMWGVYDDSAVLKPLIDKFQEKNPTIKVTYTKKQYADYEASLVDQIATGGGPDIFAMHNDWLPKHKGKLTPAPKNLLDTEQYKEAFVPTVYDDFVFENKIYGIPFYVDDLALVYNKTLFSKQQLYQAPVTWDDIVSYAKVLTKTAPGDPTKIEVAGISAGTAGNINRASDILLAIMLQKKTPMVASDNKSFTFNQSVPGPDGVPVYPGTESLSFYTSFANPNKSNYSWSKNMAESITAFANGQTAMLITYSYALPTIERINPSLNYGIAPMPQIKGSLDNVTFANYWGWAVSHNSKSSLAAWKFLTFLSDMEGQGFGLLDQYSSATGRATPKETNTNSTSGLAVFTKQNKEAQSVYKCNSDDFDSIILDMIKNVTDYGQSAQQAIDSAARQANDMLKKKCS